MVREIIEINEELCNGCGDCVSGCHEGAIQIIDGKARLVKEEYCDGFGDCIGHCPTGALKISKRDAPEFSDMETKKHLLATEGPEAVRRYMEAQKRHEASHKVDMPVQPLHHHHAGGGCPGSAQRELRRNGAQTAAPVSPFGPAIIPSELTQWPVQLHLVQPAAPYFDGKELVVMSTCGPIASAEVHQRYLRNRSVVVACPKLDRTEPYAAKLAAIFANNDIPNIKVVIMEVPCCRGLSQIVEQAAMLSGKDNLVIEEHVLSLDGTLKAVNRMAY